MAWKLNSSKPIYLQLIGILKSQIVSGQYAPGEKLKSVRDLAAEAGVNPNTMQKALAGLEDEGLIYTNRTSGRYVTEDEDILQQIRSENAGGLILDFLKSMQNMGFTKDDIFQLLEHHMNTQIHSVSLNQEED